MRLLFLHSDNFEYNVKNKAVDDPEEIPEGRKHASAKDALVIFTTIEKFDESSPDQVVEEASQAVKEVADKVSAKTIVLYPYAHLSSQLGSRDVCLEILRGLDETLSGLGFRVLRSPYGWYKSFSIKCKGHPLSELSRNVMVSEVKKPETQPSVYYKVLDLNGNLYTPEEYVFKKNEEEFRFLVNKEALKVDSKGGLPKFLGYCRKFGVEWESYSDVGHMRYSPEGTLMFDLISDYAKDVAYSLKLPLFQIRGSNMFNLAEKPVKEHAKLFGDKLYEMKVDGRDLVMRYAACHQQFSSVKDWNISYRNIPFGTFEVADSYRLERRGELLLCFRVRKLHMPDLHLYCRDLEDSKRVSLTVHKKIYEEIRKLGREYVSIYNTTETFFEKNRQFFRELVEVEGKPILLCFVPSDVFYWVINVEYTVIDELGRPREIATFQIDIGNSKRFDIKFVDEDGREVYPPIIHTALIGTVERYLFTIFDNAVRMEKSGLKPSLPIWLSPVQVRVLPVSGEHLDFAVKLCTHFNQLLIRADVDDRTESVSKKVREAEVEWIPFIVVVGRKEAEHGVLSVRVRGEKGEKTMSIEELVDKVKERVMGYPFRPLSFPEKVSLRPGYRSI